MPKKSKLNASRSQIWSGSSQSGRDILETLESLSSKENFSAECCKYLVFYGAITFEIHQLSHRELLVRYLSAKILLDMFIQYPSEVTEFLEIEMKSKKICVLEFINQLVTECQTISSSSTTEPSHTKLFEVFFRNISLKDIEVWIK